MHILLTNDDGPPGEASPFIKSLIDALQATGHDISICLPAEQKSWIGKAHLVAQHLTPTFYRPDTKSVHEEARTDGGEEWVLLDGTPAACLQIGLHHIFKKKGEVDLVISGPNFGRNSTAVLSLSSGTLGASLEAAISGCKSIAISYAYNTRDHDLDIVNAASELSVRLVDYLYKNWPEDDSTDIYTINIPLQKGIESARILYTHILQNTWSTCYRAIEVDSVEPDPNERERQIREGIIAPEQNNNGEGTGKKKLKKYKWAPKFAEVGKAAAAENAQGSDGWALSQGWVSVTPLKANYLHGPRIGEEIRL